jgi:hypothetical protein
MSEPQAGTRETIPVAGGRTRFVASCDGDETVIAMPGGNAYSLKHPKNVGHCDITIICYDQQKNPIQGTSVELKSGGGLLVYTCPAWTFSIAFRCEEVDKHPSCILEVDD